MCGFANIWECFAWYSLPTLDEDRPKVKRENSFPPIDSFIRRWAVPGQEGGHLPGRVCISRQTPASERDAATYRDHEAVEDARVKD